MLRRSLIRMIVICVGMALLTATQCAAPATQVTIVETAVVEAEAEKPAQETVVKAPEPETGVVRFVIWGTTNEFERQKLDELKADFEKASGYEVDLIFLSEW
jgi:ABC-type glycerol-3-phosphate transport system substrate-binding protein